MRFAEKINAYGNCVKNRLKETVTLEDLEINGRIILRCTLKNWVERMEVVLTGFGSDEMTGFRVGSVGNWLDI